MKWDEQDTAWNKHLKDLAEEVDIPAELIWSSRQQLITIFGQEWLEAELAKHKIASHLKDTGVVGVITNPIVNNAVGVVELAKYLQSLSHQPNFNQIVVKLKNASDYQAIRLNLAVGYRLKNIGWEDVFVEPELGDVEGIYNGQKYIVECAMFSPPAPIKKYLQGLFDSFYKYLKKNSHRTWLHVEFLKNPTEINQAELIKDIKTANYKFAPSGEFVEIKADGYIVTVQQLTAENIELLESDREKEEDSLVDIGYHLANHKPNTPGDIYSVDLDDKSKQTDVGYVTFGGVRKNSDKKSTEDQLRAKIKSKKEQTKNHPETTRRMFVFQAEGMVEKEDIHSIGEVVRSSIKPGDDIDDVIILDRRHQTAFGKLRYPSGQYHILTASQRVPYLEKMVTDMKEFEYSDWVVK